MAPAAKRKRDSSIPTLVYAAPGHNRFAKLFTEDSLDQVKEVIRSRLNLSAISDLTLFYDTDIALENDDDFDAFAVHAESSTSAINVLVKIRAGSQTPAAPNGAGPSSTAAESAGDSGPPRKKRKVVDASVSKPVSAAPALKKQKGKAVVTKGEMSSASPADNSSVPRVDEPPTEERKTKRKKTAQEPVTTEQDGGVPVGASDDASASDPVAEPNAEEPRKKKAKTTASGSDNLPSKSVKPKLIPKIATGVGSGTGSVADQTSEEPRKKKTKISESGSKNALAPSDAPNSLLPDPEATVVPERRKKKSKATERPVSPAPSADAPGSSVVTVPPLAAESKKSKSKKKSEGSATAASSKKPKKSKVEFQSGVVPSADPNPTNSVNLSLPEQLSEVVSAGSGAAQGSAQKTQEPPLGEKAKKPLKNKKKTAQGETKDVETPKPKDSRKESLTSVSASEYLKSLIKNLPVASKSTPESTSSIHQTTPRPVMNRKTGANGYATTVGDSATPQNVNPHFLVLPAPAEKAGVSDAPLGISGRKLAKSNHVLDDDTSDDSDAAPISHRILKPLPVGSFADPELDAIIHGPTNSRLTVDDVLLGEEEEAESDGAASVVLEEDNEEDITFRRRSRRLNAAVASSDEEDGDEENNNISDPEVPDVQPPPVLSVSASAPLRPRRSSIRSLTEPLMAIDSRQSQSMDIDRAGDIAVGDAMASDAVMFGMPSTPVVANDGEGTVEDVVDHSVTSNSSPLPLSEMTTKPNSAHERTPKGATADLEGDDPIQPAEDFPPTPAQTNKSPGSPSTPRMVQRMKERTGKLPVRLSQLNLPISLSSPKIQMSTPSVQHTESDDPADDQPEATVLPPKLTKTRSSSRLATAVTVPPPTEEQPPTKRRGRGPNKTAEQKAQEAAAKLAAKEERERLKKEKAQAKVRGKKGAKGLLNKDDCPPTTLQADASPSEGTVELPRTEAISQNEWTVLRPSSSYGDDYREESMRDELRSSSPGSNAEDVQVPSFLPAESQILISQPNGVTKEASSSPKDSDDDSEEEIAALMNSSQRPAKLSSSYRRLTDIASQPLLFSTPALKTTEFPPATFPNSRDQRNELYGTQDDSSDSDSAGEGAPSHIPKSRRAGKR